jgi:hypothetical protein
MTDSPDKLPPASGFEKQAEEQSPGIVREFFQFLRENKKWWLLPIVLVLLAFGVLLMLGPSVAPFIYTLF